MAGEIDWGKIIGTIVKGCLLYWILSEVNLQPPSYPSLETNDQPSYPQPMYSTTSSLPTPETNNLSLPGKLVLPNDIKWLSIIRHPSVELILGSRGSGKTALGYRQLELLRWGLNAYVLGVPKNAQKLLPDWIGMADNIENIPQNSITLVDEAYLLYHSRGSMRTGREMMSQVLNLSRQKNQTFIFVAQEARQIDKNIASSADIVVFKEPGVLQLQFDRSELNKVMTQAKTAFDTIKGDKRPWSFVYAPTVNFMELVENSLPTFWKPSISRTFAGGDTTSGKRAAKETTRDEKIKRAKELYQGGLSYRKIGKTMGINEATAYNYVNDYPYKDTEASRFTYPKNYLPNLGT